MQAGYDVADGLDVLGSDDIQFLMKFVYKSTALGPTVRALIKPIVIAPTHGPSSF